MTKNNTSPNKREYLMTDNRVDIYGTWYAEYDTRKEAFQGALWYLQLRLTSGIPTRKPYILTDEFNGHCDVNLGYLFVDYTGETCYEDRIRIDNLKDPQKSIAAFVIEIGEPALVASVIWIVLQMGPAPLKTNSG
jgi:hypothetical protein